MADPYHYKGQKAIALSFKSEKVAIIDIDTVLADFINPWFDFLMRKTGRALAHEAGTYSVESLVRKTLGTEEGQKLLDEFYSSGYCAILPVVPGSQKTMRFLRNLGFKLHVVTGRPADKYPNLIADTATWLTENEFPFDSLTFTRDKLGFAKRFDYSKCHSLVIEDHVDYAQDLAQIVDYAYLRNMHYNIEHPTSANVRRFWQFRDCRKQILADLMIGTASPKVLEQGLTGRQP